MSTLDRDSPLCGTFLSPSNPIISTAMDRDRTHILAGHKSSIRLFKVCRNPGAEMFQQMCDLIPTQGLKQISWNQVFEEKIAVASDKEIMIYDMEDHGRDDAEFEKSTFRAKDYVGSINHIQWSNNHPNVILVSEGNLMRVWDLREGKLGSCIDARFLNTVNFDDVMPNFKINCDNTLIGSATYGGMIQLYDLQKIGHPDFNSVFMNVLSNGCSLFEFDPIERNCFYDCGLGQLNCWEITGGRAIQKASINSITSVSHLLRSKASPDIFFVVGQGSEKNEVEVHGFNIRHKYRPERLYRVPNISKVLNFMLAEKAELLVLHDKEKLVGFNMHNFSNLYTSAPCCPVLLDDEKHQLIYNLELPSDIVKRYDKKYSKPILYATEPQITLPSKMSLKEELEFIHANYKILGNTEDISVENVKVARMLNKKLCEDMWNNLPLLLPRPDLEEDSEDQLKGQESSDIDLEEILQEVIDQGQFPTVVYFTIVVNKYNPSLLSIGFKKRIFADYIEILRKFELYHIATRICMDSNTPEITLTTQQNTLSKLICTKCKKKIPEHSNCCQTPGCTKMICILCKEPLDGQMLWCQGCSHSFHVDHAIDWFSMTDECPYACGHKCYKITQQDVTKMELMKKRAQYFTNHPLLSQENRFD